MGYLFRPPGRQRLLMCRKGETPQNRKSNSLHFDWGAAPSLRRWRRGVAGPRPKIRSDPPCLVRQLDNQSRRPASSVANSCTSGTKVFLPQRMYQGHQNSGPRTSDWMAQAYRPSKNIYLLGIQPHYFLIGKSHDGEGFVDLKEVNIGEFHPCSLQCQWNGICGCSGEPFRGLGRTGKSFNDCKRGQVQFLSLRGAHQKQGCCTVVDTAGICCGDGSVLFKSRPEVWYFFEIDPVEFFIFCHDGDRATAVFYLNLRNFILKITGIPGV